MEEDLIIQPSTDEDFDDVLPDPSGYKENDLLLEEGNDVVNQQQQNQIKQIQVQEVLMTPEEVRQRRRLLTKIQSAQINFPEDYARLGIRQSDLENASNEQLQLVIEDILTMRSVRSSFQFFGQFMDLCMNLLESCGSLIGLELNGLSKSLNSNSQYHECIKDLNFEMADKIKTNPYQRLGIIVFTSVIQTHHANSMMKSFNKDSISSDNELVSEINKL